MGCRDYNIMFAGNMENRFKHRNLAYEAVFPEKTANTRRQQGLLEFRKIKRNENTEIRRMRYQSLCVYPLSLQGLLIKIKNLLHTSCDFQELEGVLSSLLDLIRKQCEPTDSSELILLLQCFLDYSYPCSIVFLSCSCLSHLNCEDNQICIGIVDRYMKVLSNRSIQCSAAVIKGISRLGESNPMVKEYVLKTDIIRIMDMLIKRNDVPELRAAVRCFLAVFCVEMIYPYQVPLFVHYLKIEKELVVDDILLFLKLLTVHDDTLSRCFSAQNSVSLVKALNIIANILAFGGSEPERVLTKCLVDSLAYLIDHSSASVRHRALCELKSIANYFKQRNPLNRKPEILMNIMRKSNNPVATKFINNLVLASDSMQTLGLLHLGLLESLAEGAYEGRDQIPVIKSLFDISLNLLGAGLEIADCNRLLPGALISDYSLEDLETFVFDRNDTNTLIIQLQVSFYL